MYCTIPLCREACVPTAHNIQWALMIVCFYIKFPKPKRRLEWPPKFRLQLGLRPTHTLTRLPVIDCEKQIQLPSSSQPRGGTGRREETPLPCAPWCPYSSPPGDRGGRTANLSRHQVTPPPCFPQNVPLQNIQSGHVPQSAYPRDPQRHIGETQCKFHLSTDAGNVPQIEGEGWGERADGSKKKKKRHGGFPMQACSLQHKEPVNKNVPWDEKPQSKKKNVLKNRAANHATRASAEQADMREREEACARSDWPQKRPMTGALSCSSWGRGEVSYSTYVQRQRPTAMRNSDQPASGGESESGREESVKGRAK